LRELLQFLRRAALAAKRHAWQLISATLNNRPVPVQENFGLKRTTLKNG